MRQRAIILLRELLEMMDSPYSIHESISNRPMPTTLVAHTSCALCWRLRIGVGLHHNGSQKHFVYSYCKSSQCV